MTEPTPGPWEACGGMAVGCQCGQIWSTSADRIVAIATCVDNAAADDLEAQETYVESLDEMKANARLIAASRKLLTAAEQLLRPATASREQWGTYIDDLRAAVAKARGES